LIWGVVLLLALLLASPACRHRRTIAVDHDGAIDDYLALLLVLNAPDRRLLGVTISFGNAYPESAVEATRRLLITYGRQPLVGVYRPGQRGKNEFPPDWRRTSAGVAELATLKPAGRVSARDSVTMLRHLLDRGSLHNIDVLVTGPLTNLAAVLHRRESALQRIRRLVVMGGAVRVPGNAPGGAEYNFFVDPEAAEYVLSLTRRGLRLELVPLDTTRNFPVTAPFLERLRSSSAAAARRAAEILSLAGPSLHEPGYYLWDAAAALALLRPELFTFQDLRLRMASGGRIVEGSEGAGPIHVATGMRPGVDPLAEVVAMLEREDH
jgi:purine nucleosidase